MKKYTITDEQVNRMKQALLEIERWKGEAYQSGDEVDLAMRDLKTILSVTKYGEFAEWCPHCENEIDGLWRSIQDCPECGKVLVGCAMCNNCGKDGDLGCGNCPDGTDKNYDVDITDL